jgi:hypothetical protein
MMGRAMCAVAAAIVTSASVSAVVRGEDRIAYNRDILPILSDNCFACHGPDAKKREAELRLDVREDAVRLRDDHYAIQPGKPQASELIHRITSQDDDQRMPPAASNKKLTEAQKELLRRWIAEGAEYQPHWAYIVPKRPEVPKLASTAVVRNPIDAFIQQALEKRDVKPSPEADRRTLLRRLALDVVGLPPSLEDIRKFNNDASDEAYESQVDRLLKSPHYGERLASLWLDVVRYSDTVGYHGDQNHNAWAYRDYVIDSFNANQPFDKFTLEQLAGDLLPNPTPEQRTATCFNRLNMMTREGGAQPKEYLAKYTADRIRTVGMAWLGSTFNCAECHDHKFDPIKTKDFYSLGAFFADVKQWGVYQDYAYTPNPDLKGWTNEHPWPPEIEVQSRALKRRIEKLRAQIAEVVTQSLPPEKDFADWQTKTAAFIKRNSTGWETPTPTVKLGSAAPAKSRKKSTKTRPPADTTSDSAAAPTSGVVVVENDRLMVFEPSAPADFDVDLRPSGEWIAAVRIELLPHDNHQRKIARRGDSVTLKPTFFAIGAGDKRRNLAVRHAQADRYAPRYANGFEIIGVQASWRTDPKESDQPHAAVYFLDPPVRLVNGESLRVRFADSPIGAMQISLSPLSPDVQTPLAQIDLSQSLSNETTAREYYLRSTAWNPTAFARIKSLEAEILECRDGKTPVMITERVDKPLTIRVLPRGNWMDDSGEICKPETPSFLPKLPGTDGRELTRADLARWLCWAENPLTARVFVNRLWKHFFGTGLAAQIDDLGAQGEPPSHPELLDWLAVEFRERGWNVKHVVKLMVMSHTYRQSARLRPELRDSDPNNRLLASQNPRRLEAEIVRDNALAIAGLVDLEMGGPPCRPYQPAGYYEGLQFPDREYAPHRDDRQWRRGIYMHWQRTFLHPMLANFDAPSREDCIAMRTAANSPQQALTLLNDPTFVEAARVWAAKLLASPAANDAERLNRAFEQAVARSANDIERNALATLLSKLREEYRSRPLDAERLIKTGIAPPEAGRDPVEWAAWTNIARVILNLHETITRY